MGRSAAWVALISLVLVSVKYSQAQEQAAVGPSASPTDNGQPSSGRSLLQNPDKPALTKYGGVNMTSKSRLDSLAQSAITCLPVQLPRMCTCAVSVLCYVWVHTMSQFSWPCAAASCSASSKWVPSRRVQGQHQGWLGPDPVPHTSWQEQAQHAWQTTCDIPPPWYHTFQRLLHTFQRE